MNLSITYIGFRVTLINYGKLETLSISYIFKIPIIWKIALTSQLSSFSIIAQCKLHHLGRGVEETHHIKILEPSTIECAILRERERAIRNINASDIVSSMKCMNQISLWNFLKILTREKVVFILIDCIKSDSNFYPTYSNIIFVVQTLSSRPQISICFMYLNV